MSMNTLTVDGEFRYIIQWFNEFSELQREDFVPVLVEYLMQDAPNGVYMNGLVNKVTSVSINDKPMSLFQCRLKLFREWSPKWPLELRQKLAEKIKEIDAKVGDKVMKEIKRQNNGPTNGTVENAAEEQEEEVPSIEIINAAVAIVEATEAAINADNRLVALLNNETSVDDDDDDNDKNDNNVADGDDAATIEADDAHAELAEQVQLQTQQENVTVSNHAEVPLVA